jgi:hypothetical protein
MKLVVLVDGSTSNFEKMIEIAGRKEALFINTQNCDEVHEYAYLLKSIKEFSHSDKEILLAKFSGRESVVEDLGDDCPEMIIPLSYNKNSKYYTENTIDVFLDLITVFEKGDLKQQLSVH